MIYLVNKIKKRNISDEGIEYFPVVLFAEADNLLEASEKIIDFLKNCNNSYRMDDGGFFIALYQMAEEVEVLIK
jgi:hypothetical protein